MDHIDAAHPAQSSIVKSQSSFLFSSLTLWSLSALSIYFYTPVITIRQDQYEQEHGHTRQGFFNLSSFFGIDVEKDVDATRGATIVSYFSGPV